MKTAIGIIVIQLNLMVVMELLNPMCELNRPPAHTNMASPQPGNSSNNNQYRTSKP